MLSQISSEHFHTTDFDITVSSTSNFSANPLLDERVSGVPVEPELHPQIYLRNVSDGTRSPLTFLVHERCA